MLTGSYHKLHLLHYIYYNYLGLHLRTASKSELFSSCVCGGGGGGEGVVTEGDHVCEEAILIQQMSSALVTSEE